MRNIEDKVFIGFVILVTLAMGWVVMPFYGAILWGIVATITFAPINRWLTAILGGRRNTAAILTLLLIVAIVIVPAVLISTLLIEEALATYGQIENQKIDLGKLIFDQVHMLPPALQALIARFDLGNLESIEQNLTSFLTGGLRVVATKALEVAQGTFSFVIALGIMLYLTFFLLRDADSILETIGRQVPLHRAERRDLIEKFTTVIRATVKGSIVVAIVQGLLGGLAFGLLGIEAPLLWGVVMGVLSLVPVIGTGFVWVPVSIYLLVTGSVWQGVVLFLIGFFIISMVDNILRPILVGKDTRMPDYVVLISTLGGISAIGINGFIVGPMIAAMFIAAWDIFTDGRRSAKAALEAAEHDAAPPAVPPPA